MGNPDKEFLSAEEMMLRSDCRPIERIYVDLEYLQDLRLGALINNITVEEEFRYLVHNISKYNDRYDLKTAKYFKALHVSEEDINNSLKDEKLVNRICLVTAPFTSIYSNLFQIIISAKNHLKAFEEHKKQLTLTINCSDVKYPEILQKKLCDTISRNLDIRVEFISNKRYTLPVSEYLNYQLLMLYDYGEFIRSCAVPFISNGSFVETKIVAQPYIEDEILAKTEDPEDLLNVTEKSIDIYCDFNYLRANVVKTN